MSTQVARQDSSETWRFDPGYAILLAALALAVFCVVTAVLYHFVPADQMQMTMFFKNLGLAGGYLLLANAGSGAFSVDARKG